MIKQQVSKLTDNFIRKLEEKKQENQNITREEAKELAKQQILEFAKVLVLMK